jgi:hypothetical protein
MWLLGRRSDGLGAGYERIPGGLKPSETYTLRALEGTMPEIQKAIALAYPSSSARLSSSIARIARPAFHAIGGAAASLPTLGIPPKRAYDVFKR